ncbi:hypothetical protein ACA29_02810, partial [Lederbergia galactosidilytica]
MLNIERRRKIENGFKGTTRLQKKKMFQEVSKCFRICDACPFNGQAISDAEPHEQNSYESVCGPCSNYKRLRELGDYLWEKETNIEFLLAKGKNLTADEVLYLLEEGAKEGATKKSIQKALGFTNPKQLNGFLNFIKEKS